LLAEGFDEILTKPFREQKLVALLGLHPAEGALTPTPDNDAVDFNVIRRMTMGDEALFLSILSQFSDETSSDITELEHHLKRVDARESREVIHKLAGRVGQIGALSLSTKLRVLEVDLDSGKDLAAIGQPIANAVDGVKKLLDQIHIMISTAKI
jgi:HPt (histidine-containing phosphotransfer) domain-containing protein